MTVPAIFDRPLQNLRRRNRRPCPPEPLLDQLALEFRDRLSLINRSFARPVLLGRFAAQLATRMGFGKALAPCSIIEFETEAELHDLPEGGFDCVLYGLGLEAMNDPAGALIALRRALQPDGVLLACLFAGDTLCELRAAWLAAEAALRGGASPRVAPFAELRDLGSLLQRAGYALPVADIDHLVLRYPSALALMAEIRQSGLGAALQARSRRPVTASLLAAAAEYYERNFSDPDGRVRATVDIAWLTGWAPHHSQPRPLAPGSAKKRLADALGTRERPLSRD